MKGKIFYLVVLIAFACAKKSEPVPEPPVIAAPEQETPTENDCFARKEEKWFISFNKYQENGDNMEVADKKALADAEKEYQDCMSGKGKLSSDAEK